MTTAPSEGGPAVGAASSTHEEAAEDTNREEEDAQTNPTASKLIGEHATLQGESEWCKFIDTLQIANNTTSSKAMHLYWQLSVH